MPIEFIAGAFGGLVRAVLSSKTTVRDATLSAFFGLASAGLIALWYSITPVEGFLIGFAGSELLQRTVRIVQALSRENSAPNLRPEKKQEKKQGKKQTSKHSKKSRTRTRR